MPTPSVHRLALLALLLHPGLAGANMAAPSFATGLPLSSALRPAGAGLTVRRETLTFEVGAQEAAVAAEYLVDAAAGADLALTFISPAGSTGVRAWVNGEERSVTTGPYDGGAASGAREEDRHGPFGALRQGGFTAQFRAGENRIRVTYGQGFGLFWIPVGYFHDPLYLRVFPYELWPLRGWTLAPGFQLDLKVSVALPRAGWWTRTFGKVPGWSLHVVGSPRGVDPQEYFRGPWRNYQRGEDMAPQVRRELDREDLWQLAPVAEAVHGPLLGGALVLETSVGPLLPDRLYLVLDVGKDGG